MLTMCTGHSLRQVSVRLYEMLARYLRGVNAILILISFLRRLPVIAVGARLRYLASNIPMPYDMLARKLVVV